MVCAFQAARLCCQVQVQGLHPTTASGEELKLFPFVNNDATITGLVHELPHYLAIPDGVVVKSEEGKVCWWSTHERALPNWSAPVKKILLIQPSSASAERVFSILQNTFSKQQDAALEETVEASVMLRYNGNKRGVLP